MQRLLAAALLAAVLGGCATSPAPEPVDTPAFVTSHLMDAGFEPRIAVGPDGTHWVSTQATGRVEQIYRSPDGIHWNKTPNDPQTQRSNHDNEIVVTPTGRVITAVIDDGVTFNIAYSDDQGTTWTRSQGNVGEDQDREWLAVGGTDPATGQTDVYLLWHNLVSGLATHNMFVATSRDNGATFDPPVPITTPPQQAWLDLQCAGSGGPSNIVANSETGQVYAVYGARAGGCMAPGDPQINIVAATRTWVVTSKDQGRTWTPSLAVDDHDEHVVAMQVNAGALDNEGNVYVVYPESPAPYPQYDGAAVRVVWAPADLSKWSQPITVFPGSSDEGTGNLLTHIAVGDPGRFAVFSMQATKEEPKRWYPTVATTQDGFSPMPTFDVHRVGDAAWNGTGSELMGACAQGTASTFNGFVCPRASDVLGQAIGADCKPAFVWYQDTQPRGTYATKATRSLCG